MSKADNLQLVEQWYQSLEKVDLELFVSIHHPEVIYNIAGHTPISGQVRGISTLMDKVLPHVFGALNPEEFKFGTKREIVCADESRIVGVMEADGPGTNGKRYDQRYVHMFSFRDGKIGGVWEFFDTALANAVLFTDPDLTVEGVDTTGFSIL